MQGSVPPRLRKQKPGVTLDYVHFLPFPFSLNLLRMSSSRYLLAQSLPPHPGRRCAQPDPSNLLPEPSRWHGLDFPLSPLPVEWMDYFLLLWLSVLRLCCLVLLKNRIVIIILKTHIVLSKLAKHFLIHEIVWFWEALGGAVLIIHIYSYEGPGFRGVIFLEPSALEP